MIIILFQVSILKIDSHYTMDLNPFFFFPVNEWKETQTKRINKWMNGFHKNMSKYIYKYFKVHI